MRSSVTAGLLALLMAPASLLAILAGDEFGLPDDFPSNRLDTAGAASAFNFVGALEISDGSNNYFGTGAALNRNWVLTAGHNVDFNDDGIADAGLTLNFHLPGFGSYTATSIAINPDFDGFGNPTVHNDLSLLYFANPLPIGLQFPSLNQSMAINDTVTLVGFGRSGFGSYGYTTNASLTDRRTGQNVIDTFQNQAGGDGVLFRYDFDDADTFGQLDGSLGNDIETLIGPGDSGGPALRDVGGSYALVGVNTFTEGFGGQFGDLGGGVALDPHWNWINTAIAIPEPGSLPLLLIGLYLIHLRRRRDEASLND